MVVVTFCLGDVWSIRLTVCAAKCSRALRCNALLSQTPSSLAPRCTSTYCLTKGEFWDGLCLRYGWTPARVPSHCSCGQEATVAHSLSCPYGGFPSIRHNGIRDVTARLLDEVCTSVSIEPLLQPLTGERLRYRTANVEDRALLDVAANGLWGSRFERRLLSSLSLSLSSVYKNFVTFI